MISKGSGVAKVTQVQIQASDICRYGTFLLATSEKKKINKKSADFPPIKMKVMVICATRWWNIKKPTFLQKASENLPQ